MCLCCGKERKSSGWSVEHCMCVVGSFAPHQVGAVVSDTHREQSLTDWVADGSRCGRSGHQSQSSINQCDRSVTLRKSLICSYYYTQYVSLLYLSQTDFYCSKVYGLV